jgi:hypothetical protein
MRSSLFWGVVQCKLAVSYRCFGSTYRSHLQGSTLKMRPIGWTETSVTINLRCVTSQKSKDLSGTFIVDLYCGWIVSTSRFYWLRRYGVWLPLGQNVQVGSGIHSASYSIVTGSFPQGYHEVYHPHLSSSEVKMAEAVYSLSLYAFVACVGSILPLALHFTLSPK